MSAERKSIISPEERTSALFSKNCNELAQELEGRVVALPESVKEVLLTVVDPWSKVGPRYKDIYNLNPGDILIYDYQFRRMKQSLIAALDRGQKGACVRIMKVAVFDPLKGEYIPKPNEGEFTTYFGLKPEDSVRLAFVDNTDKLYLVGSNRRSKSGKLSVSSQEANEIFDRLFR